MGGGPTGLYFALVMKLQDSGHDVTVFERNGTDSTYGWGVTFGADLLAKLYRSDPLSAREIDQAAFHWVNQVVDVQGKPIQRASGDGYSIKRQRFLDIMAERAKGLGVQVEFDHEVMAPPHLPEVDLIVACDGVNSRTRLAASFQTDVRISANKYMWLGTSKVFESFMYAFVPTGSGWVWAYAYGVDAESSTFIVECSPETWTGLGLDTMPPRDSLCLLEKLFERQLDGHPLVGQNRGSADVQWLNFRTVTNQRWHDGKIVLAGDAAHTAHYSIGWGTKLAIEDVIALAENLQHHDTLERALQSYQAQRHAALLPPQGEARCSAQWFENLSRYIDLEPHQFSMLLHGRRSPILPHVPPRLYCRLLRATEEITVLRELRRRVSPRAKALYSRRNQANDSPAGTVVSKANEH
ncbi:MAG TPA: FAD-dependent monooxygenase [Streptosporangiaceae bacterium]|nr:FAD-dependent monooxygenase [Streptosporangiaceae bacterium]